MDYNQVLVYILSIALFVLIVLSIVVVSYLIKLLRSVQHIAEKAEHASDNIAAFSNTVRRAAVPTGAIGVLKVLTKEIMNFKSKENDNG